MERVVAALDGRVLAAVLHHAVVGGGGRHVGDLEVAECLHQPHGIEAAGESPCGDAHGERSERAVPQAVAPCRAGGAEEFIAGADAGAIERGKHQRDERAVRMLDRLGQLAGGAAGVLEHGHVVGLALGRVGRRVLLDQIEQAVIGDDHARGAVGANRAARQFGLLGIGDEDRRVAVADAQLERIGAEQGEHRHRDRAGLHRAEQADVKRQ